MKSKPRAPETASLLLPPLLLMLDQNDEMVKLANLIDWGRFETAWSEFFPSGKGRPATPARMVAGLLYLQHAYGLSDEGIVRAWKNTPVFQYFCGETYFEPKFPVNPSTLTRWRNRIGAEGIEEMLAETVAVAQKCGAIKPADLKRLAVDTTVMEKAAAYPTDSKLVEDARRLLVKMASVADLSLRQNYNRIGPRLARKIGRLAYRGDTEGMKQTAKKQRALAARVWRDVERQLAGVPSEEMRQKVSEALELCWIAITQGPANEKKRAGKNSATRVRRLLSIFYTELECLCKGGKKKKTKFGVKVATATSTKGGVITGAQSQPGNPHDGHTLARTLEHVKRVTGVAPREVHVDRGYTGHNVTDCDVWMTGKLQGAPKAVQKRHSRRNAIEPSIGHMKSDGRLDRCTLKGAHGDAQFATLCGCGQNIRLLLRYLRIFFALFFCRLLCHIFGPAGPARSFARRD